MASSLLAPVAADGADAAGASATPAPGLRWGVVVFPGTNCDLETHHVLGNVLGQEVRYVWHQDTDLSGLDALVLPGGFAHGDYLRSGAVARFSPVMGAVTRFAEEGKPLLGICNGFQVLLEAGLLPGAMLRNRSQSFVCRWVHLRVENPASPFLAACAPEQILRIPIAHGEGSYFVERDDLTRMEERGQVLLRYCDPGGRLTAAANPNGSIDSIAGISSPAGNVMGLMPHPERASERVLGSEDGRKLFESVVHSFAKRR